MSFVQTLYNLKEKILPNSGKKRTDLHQDYFLLNEETEPRVREAYNVLRTNLIFLMSQSERKQIVFTSSLPGEGKTTTSLNTAIMFAHTGAKVLLIDADMRRPKIHRALKRKHTPGLADVLGKLKTANEAIQNTSVPNLDVLTAGTTPPNPSELLLSNQLNALLDEMAQIYDYVFVDAPPIKSVTDAAIISTKLAGAIMVVRSEITHKPDIADSMAAFDAAGGKVLGFILNDIAKEYMSGYSSKYHRYYSDYYSSYSGKKTVSSPSEAPKTGE